MKMNNYSLKNLLICFMLGFLSIALLIGVLSLFGVIGKSGEPDHYIPVRSDH